MLIRNRVLPGVLGLAIGVLLALLVAPNSRWMVLAHARMMASPHPEAVLGLAPQTGTGLLWSTPEQAQPQPVAPAEATAASIRAACRRIASHEGRADWRGLLAQARAGAAADPDNAFFPAVQAVAFSGLHSSAGTAAALQRAAGKPVWRDYVTESVKAAWRVGDRNHGAGNTFWRASVPAGADLAHYGLLWRAASCALSETSAPPSLRRAVLRLGATVRDQSTTVAGVACGRELQKAALSGNRVPAADARWVEVQTRANQAMASAIDEGSQRFDIVRGLRGYALWFAAAMLMLDGAAWLLALAALSALAARTGFRGWRTVGLALAAVLAVLWGLTTMSRGLGALQPAVALMRGGIAWSQACGALAAGTLLPAAVVAAAVCICAYRDGEAWGLGYLRRFCAWAVPAACACVVLYGLLAVKTVRVAESTNRAVASMVANEGRFYAALAGKPWPGR